MLFRSIVDRGVSKRRRNDSCPGFHLTSLLDCFQCSQHDEHISNGNLGEAVPPFGCAFSTARGMQGVLAVANEEGIVRLYNTENRKSPVLKEWMAHENAVFDIAWVPGETSLVTASGDQLAKLWDVKSQNLLGSFKGHQCSLKSVSFTQQEKSVFCTGGRDGNIMIWDTRCSKKDGFYRQVKQISGAHNKMDTHTPSKMKKRRPGQRGRAPSVDSQQSVTVVLFRDEHTLISTGAVDGIIKMWDLRKNYTAHLQDPTPLLAYPYPGASTRKLGYSGLVLDSSGANLFANCTDDNIYMFNISGLKTTPVALFTGHRNSSFYVKSSVSPDDQFLASGSSDHHTYIWKISDPKQATMMLQGHSQEVTSIAWCPTDFTKIASCSDDNTVRIWRLDRGMDGAKSSVAGANLVGWACPGPTSTVASSRPLNQAEHTPPKNPRTENLGGLSSPQPAACAPSGAALPLPSSTSSPTQAQGAKANRPHLRTPTSIRQWCSHTAPIEQASPPLRQVLSPCPQSPAPGTPPSERRAKRRLETGSGDLGSCGGMRNCDCVTELYPAAKRSRPLVGVCCAQEGPQAGTEKILEGEELHMQDQKPFRQADKENSSLGVVDWLSVMGRKLKEGPGGPSSPKSPSASKRQDGRTPPSPSLSSPNAMKKISSYFQRVTPN
ncbi:denticleless protein homolog [Osmerus eperlanus]|uniref:denticleless protein homolog n=1 Tax=Osmerus eperlanus TaxID=29151 RepID=UPI002E113EDF